MKKNRERKVFEHFKRICLALIPISFIILPVSAATKTTEVACQNYIYRVYHKGA